MIEKIDSFICRCGNKFLPHSGALLQMCDDCRLKCIKARIEEVKRKAPAAKQGQ